MNEVTWNSWSIESGLGIIHERVNNEMEDKPHLDHIKMRENYLLTNFRSKLMCLDLQASTYVHRGSFIKRAQKGTILKNYV